MALTISQLVNDYGSYSGKTLVGELGSRATVPGGGFGGVRGVPYDNITFIVKVNGTRYASSRWLSQQQNGNPYIHSTSVARIDTRDIGLMPIDKSPFADKEDEKYAEVEAKSKLAKSDDEILKFINYLLDGRDGTDPAIPTFGEFSPKDFGGNPSVTQTINSPTGQTYEVGVRVGSKLGKSWTGVYSPEDDLKGGYPGMQFKPTGFDGSVEGQEALSVPLPPVESDDVTEPVDLGEDFQIDLSDFTFDPIDFELDPIDFGFGDINTNFGFGLGGDVSVGGTNQFTSVNYAGDDFTTRASTAYSGFVTDANDFNEPEVFGGFGSFG